MNPERTVQTAEFASLYADYGKFHNLEVITEADLVCMSFQRELEAVNVVSVVFSEDYFRQYRTYDGRSYTISRARLMQFRYDWDDKTVWWYSSRNGAWKKWDINRDNSHADGQPLIPNSAEVAFIAAYNMRFYDDTEGYSPVLKGYRRVISEEFYERLGI